MGEKENRVAVERFWAALQKADFDAAVGELHDDFTEEYPQSGERIRGADKWLSVVRNYPGFPSIQVRRTVGRDDLWITEAAFDYVKDGSPPWQVCQVQECRDGRIARITAFFGAPFEAAGWRAQWVEEISR